MEIPEAWAAGQTLSRLFPLRFGPAAGHRSLKRLLYIKNETVVDELVVGVEPGNRTDVVNLFSSGARAIFGARALNVDNGEGPVRSPHEAVVNQIIVLIGPGEPLRLGASARILRFDTQGTAIMTETAIGKR